MSFKVLGAELIEPSVSPVVTICKQFDFDAAHRLTGVPADHKCARLHGHTYRTDVTLRGVPDARGMVADYAEVADAWGAVHDLLDHRLLNDIPGLENPTTEVLAPFILRLLIHKTEGLMPIISVRVYESSTTWCEARVA